MFAPNVERNFSVEFGVCFIMLDISPVTSFSVHILLE